ncbi:probable E3 ubiquitin-protein ligase makorin-2 [Sinocyclocheilus grahami]|uniref:probable E3 ubiquitin-protein ligase makorin-2 n=1 Tax=Sinocyclocheilus grahami TaxID=75366 RepID=UPI0007ACB891|nr:PREDICTED: probable E3 ubiquitin-protein ligase makorin-2 [Sinocyclocheilus grahami]
MGLPTLSCPECRVVSEFVIPSMYWVEDQEEKNRLIEEFKSGVSVLMLQCAVFSDRYDHVRAPGRGGGSSAEQQNRGSSAGASAPGPGPPPSTSKHVSKPLVLRDKALGSDSRARDCWDYSSDSKPHSYLEATRCGLQSSAGAGPHPDHQQLCPYLATGHCHYGDSCPYLHGDLCEICRLQVLHPHNPEQRAAHEKMCMTAFELDMERAFAAQQSQDKQCKICLDVVYEKASPSERRFGILSSCCHTYCLSCIRQWRCAEQFQNQIRKSCPECRVVSEFVIPSMYWVEDQEEKNRLIEEFKSGVSKKPCKYFDQGRGTCPFGGKCFYMHAYADGTQAEPDKPRKQMSAEGNMRFLSSVRLWDFIEEREHRGTPADEDEVSELGELFMQLSGAGETSGSSAAR